MAIPHGWLRKIKQFWKASLHFLYTFIDKSTVAQCSSINIKKIPLQNHYYNSVQSWTLFGNEEVPIYQLCNAVNDGKNGMLVSACIKTIMTLACTNYISSWTSSQGGIWLEILTCQILLAVFISQDPTDSFLVQLAAQCCKVLTYIPWHSNVEQWRRWKIHN